MPRAPRSPFVTIYREEALDYFHPSMLTLISVSTTAPKYFFCRTAQIEVNGTA